MPAGPKDARDIFWRMSGDEPDSHADRTFHIFRNCVPAQHFATHSIQGCKDIFDIAPALFRESLSYIKPPGFCQLCHVSELHLCRILWHRPVSLSPDPLARRQKLPKVWEWVFACRHLDHCPVDDLRPACVDAKCRNPSLRRMWRQLDRVLRGTESFQCWQEDCPGDRCRQWLRPLLLPA